MDNSSWKNQWLLRQCLCTRLRPWPELSWQFVLQTRGHCSQLPGNILLFWLCRIEKGFEVLGKRSSDHMNIHREASRTYQDDPEIQKPSGAFPLANAVQSHCAASLWAAQPLPWMEIQVTSPCRTWHTKLLSRELSAGRVLFDSHSSAGPSWTQKARIPELVPSTIQFCLLSQAFSKWLLPSSVV